MKKLIIPTIALTCLALSMAGYLFVAMSRPPAPATPPASTAAISFNKPFTLTNHNGQTVTQATYLGKPTLYFFGFTHCPDICPSTLGAITSWLNDLGADAGKFNILFVSVDPERDTPETLKAYLTMFHPAITAATGTPAQIEDITRTFMVYYAKVPVKPGEDPKDYMINHSSMILLADAEGNFKGSLDAHDPDIKALGKLRALIH